MVAFSLLAVSALAATGASAAFTKPKMVLHDERVAPAGFAPVKAAAATHVIDMRVRLAQRDPEGLRAALMAASTPGSPRYGKHLTRDEVAAFTRPREESLRAVQAYFSSRGLNATAANRAGDWLRVKVPAPAANSLFAADYRVYKNAESGESLVRTLKYSLPQELQGHIDVVYPSTSFFAGNPLPMHAVAPPRQRREVPVLPDAAKLDALLGRLNGTLGGTLDGDAARVLSKLRAVAKSQATFTPEAQAAVDLDLDNIDLSGLPEWLRKILEEIFKLIQGATPGPTTGVSPPPATTCAPAPGGGGGQAPPATEEPVPAPTEEPTEPPAPEPTTEPTSAPEPEPTPAPTSDPAPEPEPTEPAPAPGGPLAPGKADPGCIDAMTPKCLQDIYHIPTTPATQKTNKLVVTGYGEEWAQHADLEAFLKTYRTDIDAKTTFEEQLIVGGRNPQGPEFAGREANLDVQYTIGIATGVPTIYMSVGDEGEETSFIETMNALIDLESPPQVVTTSYGGSESSAGVKLSAAMCNAYMQLAARGVSIIFASGDSGVGDVKGTCTDRFVPTFPSTCPYVTSVGSTYRFAPEGAAKFTGGGFSEFFPMPDYQKAAVKGYLDQLGDKYSGMYNATGRAFPDVSTQGVNFQVVVGGQTKTMWGTSASAPLFASVIALINDELAAAGKPALGFLNPWLYSEGVKGLMDVVHGSNPGCNTAGFEALRGWDPVTGLGTPHFEALRKAAGLA